MMTKKHWHNIFRLGMIFLFSFLMVSTVPVWAGGGGGRIQIDEMDTNIAYEDLIRGSFTLPGGGDYALQSLSFYLKNVDEEDRTYKIPLDVWDEVILDDFYEVSFEYDTYAEDIIVGRTMLGVTAEFVNLDTGAVTEVGYEGTLQYKNTGNNCHPLNGCVPVS